MISRRRKYFTWFVYVPILLGIIYYNLVHSSYNGPRSLDYALFLLIGVIVAMFPVRTNDSVFTLVTGVSLATFVIFGLAPELFLSSIAFLFVLFKADIRWDQHYRYALNLLMVALLSVISAVAYYGTLNFLNRQNLAEYWLIPLVVYMVVNVVGNQFFIYIIEKYFYGLEDASFFNEKLGLSFQSSLVVFPLSYILIYLYYVMGTWGIIVGAFPFLTISIGTKYFYQSRSYNSILTDLNKYSQKLTAKMDMDSVLNSFSKYLLRLFPSHHVLHFRVEDENHIVLDRIYHLDQTIECVNIPYELEEEHYLKEALETQQIQVYAKAIEWQSEKTCEAISFEAESAAVLPVHVLSQNKGILVLTHPQRAVYDDFLYSLIEVFYHYFLVVVDNAFNFERLETSSVTDYLTELPNLRGFTTKVKEVVRNENYEYLSVIVLDLDYFKKINDVHGHEAGNDVLKQVSDILKEFRNENLFIARYGGEEFILFLKDYEKEKAYQVAEEIRKTIEAKVYKPRYSILDGDQAQITVTASLGVATYPDDCDDIYDLVNLADRVMYLKSKKNGRNRVAVFAQES